MKLCLMFSGKRLFGGGTLLGRVGVGVRARDTANS